MPDSETRLRIDLTGINQATFDRLFARLAGALESAVSHLSSSPMSPEARRTLDDMASIARNFIEAKLERPSLENQKLLAEITQLFTAAEANAQQARKTAAEADRLELDNAPHRIHVILQIIAEMREVQALRTADGRALVLDTTAPSAAPRERSPRVRPPGKRW